LGVSQVAISMRLHAMGKVQKIEKWVPHKLNDRWSDIKTHAKFCLPEQKRKSFLHRIVTGDEKWIYFQNPKRKKSWVDPTQPSIFSSRINRFGRKTMLYVWWDQEGVIYYELLKSGKTVNAHRYHQQLIKLHRALREKRPHYRKRQDKLIFLHDKHHRTRQQWSKTTWRHSTGKCYLIPLTHQIWHLLIIICFRRCVTRLLSGTSILTKTSENGLMSGLLRKMRNFFGVVYTNCPKDGKNV